jgi:hypothetical protein
VVATTFRHRGRNYRVIIEHADEQTPVEVDAAQKMSEYGVDPGSRPVRSLAIKNFTIQDVATGTHVFDSKAELDRLLSSLAPDLLDGSPSEGRGRRCVALGRINRRLIAHVRLDAIDGTAVLDLTDPHNPSFVDYFDKRGNGHGV